MRISIYKEPYNHNILILHIELTYRMMKKVMKMMLKRRLRQNREMKTYKTDLSHWSQDLLESSNGFTEN